jgi:hypothetical protein
VAAKDAQLWIVSSAPHPDSEVLRRYCIRGRAGEDPHLVYFEFSAAEEVPADSTEAWRQANPALGLRIPTRSIEDGFTSMATATFEREHLGRWSETVTEAVFDLAVWNALAASPLPKPTGARALALDVTPDRRRACVAAAGALEGNRVLVEILEEREGLSWVVDEMAALMADRPDAVILDQAGQAHSLVPALQKVGIEPTITDLKTMVVACGEFYDLVTEGRLVHPSDSALNAAVEGAHQRTVGDGQWAWTRRSTKVNVAPLVSATLACYAVQHHEPPHFIYMVGAGSEPGRWIL